jgi:PAS domain S-box-containing protein
MMFSLLPDGVIRSVNREFERRTGWRRNDLIGTHFAPLVHPDDLSDALATLGQFLRSEEIDDHEVRIRTVSGDYLLTESTVVPLSSDDQGVEMVGVIHDITAQKETEEELSLTRERFRQAFKQAPLGVALIDHDARITNANHALCHLVGYTREELLGLPFPSLLHPDDLATDNELVRQLEAGTIPRYRVEQRYVTKRGDVVYGTVTAALILGDHGKPLYGMRTVEDITEKVRFGRELASHAALAKTRLATLTPREREVLELSDETITASELAAQMFVSTRTVESHLAHAYRKLGVRTRTEAREGYLRMKSLVERFEPDVLAVPNDVAT